MASLISSKATMASLEKQLKLTEIQEHQLAALLSDYVDVFASPTGLPPKRQKEHRITLVAGQGPVNVRPYRYSHHHKDEIEKQVREMLQSGIIRVLSPAQ